MGACISDCKGSRTQRHPSVDKDLSLLEVWRRKDLDLLWPEEVKTLQVFVGTWNLGCLPPTDNLKAWLRPGYDIYFIGVQEACQDRQHLWTNCVHECLKQYNIVCERSMWRNHVVCLASEAATNYLHTIESSLEETGIAHIGANKGAVAVSLYVGDISVCFVNSHLAAHQDKVQRRNSDFSEIIEGVRLGIQNRPLTNQFTHVIWAGDLNYRIDLSTEKILAHLENSDFQPLLDKDQLREAREKREAFFLFNEGPITFLPTYKHTPGEPPDSKTGRRPYATKGNRAPAWCDRILWRSAPDTQLVLEDGSYGSTPSLDSSDHDPVSAVFEMEFPSPGKMKENGPMLSISVGDLRVSDLAVASKGTYKGSFLVFSANWSKATARSTSRCRSSKMHWPADEVLELPARRGLGDPAWLASRHLLVSLRDSNSFGEEEESACAPLRGCNFEHCATSEATMRAAHCREAACHRLHVGATDTDLAYGVISLKGLRHHLLGSTNEGPSPFTCYLTRGGLPVCSLNGMMSLIVADGLPPVLAV
eukprot:TRINITY_DN16902_c0_g2_i1.p1 TRINITY_DN16902_c0_g2~~TRINITY_DN16902_c0_g2_i1.p1  ORF type:complete len:534 (+),score=73.54 TRINITY_DN16902_c0_g2_i1:179-1780(+)